MGFNRYYFFDGSDTSQVYDLRRCVSRLKQAGGSLEQYYTTLQGLWHEIDFRHPNSMECTADIHHYNKLIQEERVYTFLDGLDDKLDHIRSDVLQLYPFPTVEQAYAHVRRETNRQAVMVAGSGDLDSPAVGMAVRSDRSGTTLTDLVLGSYEGNQYSPNLKTNGGKKLYNC